MKGLFWMLFLLLAALIIYVRYHREDDEFCEFCSIGIDTSKDDYVSSRYAIDLGITRVYDEWIFCSEICEINHLAQLTDRQSDK